MEGEPERLGNFLSKERAERATVDPADELAGQPPVGEGVIAVRGGGFPARFLSCEMGSDGVPVERVGEGKGCVDGWEAGLVTQSSATVMAPLPDAANSGQ